jgi:predicted transcriptional regulator of viral defense system
VNALSDYKNPRVKINDLIKRRHVIRVKKGLYVFGPDIAQRSYCKESLANLIFGPSYITLEYALSFYGLIPERVETVTSITNKKNKIFHTPVGTFSYQYIHPSLYSIGTTLINIDELHNILIATKEKALCDILYYQEKMSDENELEQYLVESLRIDVNELKRLRLTSVRQLASLYGRNAKLFYDLLKRIKGDKDE